MMQGLFLGRELNSNEWVYGYYTELYGVGSIVKEANNQRNLLLGVYSLFVNDAIDTSDLVVDYTVDTNTVGPWTGKTDVNDVKIFESDIVDFTDNPELPPKRGVVKWDAENAQFVITLSERQSGWFDGLKVAGNVFDNPELLISSSLGPSKI